jgi:two-component system cell cycle sensor histidine kinase/response regulator CckA
MTTAAWKTNSTTSSTPTVRRTGVPDVRIANSDGTLELIMVVDDDDFIRLLAERVLTAEGYRVVSARDGYQAMDFLAKLGEQVDLVVLDFVMPTMDGAHVLSAMRQIVPNLPVIVTSGFTDNAALRDLLAKGVCGFIPKPLARNKLLLNVRATIDEFKGTL